MKITRKISAGVTQGMKALGRQANVPILRGLHWAGYGVLLSAGFKWELRRAGDLKIGLWRKTWAEKESAEKPRSRKKRAVRRFVLVPGFGDTPLSWLSIIAMLRPVMRRQYDEIVLLDFPGFGGFLSREKPFHSMDLLRESVSDVFDSLKPHTLVGHSLGGWLIGHYLASCGEAVRPKNAKRHYLGPAKAVLFNPSGAFVDETNKREWESIFRGAIREGFASLRPHVFRKEPFWFRFLAGEFSKFLTHAETIEFMESVREDHLVGDRLKSVKTPTWVVWTEHDSMIPASCAELWVREINAGAGKELARAVVMKGSGHSPQIEKPAVTAAVLGQILAERSPHPLGWRWWRLVELAES